MAGLYRRPPPACSGRPPVVLTTAATMRTLRAIMVPVRPFALRGDHITLDALLKACGLAGSGGEAKARAQVEEATAAFGALKRPTGLKGEALKAWKKYVDPAKWLDASREAAAIAFCELWAEFRFSPTSFPASKHGQMRAYMSELGLTDERNRGDIDDSAEKDEFFGAD